MFNGGHRQRREKRCAYMRDVAIDRVKTSISLYVQYIHWEYVEIFMQKSSSKEPLWPDMCPDMRVYVWHVVTKLAPRSLPRRLLALTSVAFRHWSGRVERYLMT